MSYDWTDALPARCPLGSCVRGLVAVARVQKLALPRLRRDD